MRRSRVTAVLETRIYRHLLGLHVRPHRLHRKRPEAGSNKGRSLVAEASRGRSLHKGEERLLGTRMFLLICMEVNHG